MEYQICDNCGFQTNMLIEYKTHELCGFCLAKLTESYEIEVASKTYELSLALNRGKEQQEQLNNLSEQLVEAENRADLKCVHKVKKYCSKHCRRRNRLASIRYARSKKLKKIRMVAERDQKVFEMWPNNSARHIAFELKISAKTVNKIANRGIKEGVLQPKPKNIKQIKLLIEADKHNKFVEPYRSHLSYKKIVEKGGAKNE